MRMPAAPALQPRPRQRWRRRSAPGLLRDRRRRSALRALRLRSAAVAPAPTGLPRPSTSEAASARRSSCCWTPRQLSALAPPQPTPAPAQGLPPAPLGPPPSGVDAAEQSGGGFAYWRALATSSPGFTAALPSTDPHLPPPPCSRRRVRPEPEASPCIMDMQAALTGLSPQDAAQLEAARAFLSSL